MNYYRTQRCLTLDFHLKCIFICLCVTKSIRVLPIPPVSVLRQGFPCVQVWGGGREWGQYSSEPGQEIHGDLRRPPPPPRTLLPKCKIPFLKTGLRFASPPSRPSKFPPKPDKVQYRMQQVLNIDKRLLVLNPKSDILKAVIHVG